jgi:predicted CoA-substrate-specific enzyme activase
VLVPFANENISEITCHARGVNWYFPSVRTILDIGGQDCKAINCDGNGAVTNFVMNDKCAGGTGRFLEMIADVLNVPLSEIGELALTSQTATSFNTVCAVFAKSDAIRYFRQGVKKSDILAGLNDAIAARCLSLLKRVTVEKDFAITGGIAKNSGMVYKLTEKIGMTPLLSPDPQLIGAIGAALFANDRIEGNKTVLSPKVNYGYSDGTGVYYITIDANKCDACSACVNICPEALFAISSENGKDAVVIKPEMRKKISQLCPGAGNCRKNIDKNCQSVCKNNAISHSW